MNACSTRYTPEWNMNSHTSQRFLVPESRTSRICNACENEYANKSMLCGHDYRNKQTEIPVCMSYNSNYIYVLLYDIKFYCKCVCMLIVTKLLVNDWTDLNEFLYEF